MYTHPMKRLQIMIEEELDEALEHAARKERTSKAALIRRYVAEHVKPLPPLEEDPLWDLVGTVDAEPVEDIDEYLYGPSAKP
jgi:Ribbon-helix-helix protein, copG family